MAKTENNTSERDVLREEKNENTKNIAIELFIILHIIRVCNIIVLKSFFTSFGYTACKF